MTEQEKQLLNLLQTVMDTDQAALARARRVTDGLELEIAALREKRRQASPDDALGAMQKVRERHCIWLDREIKRKVMKLAAAMAQMAEVEDQLRASFGRYQALRMHLEQ